jgi:hypothetical protein
MHAVKRINIMKKQFTHEERQQMFFDITDSLDAFLSGSKLCVSHKHLGNAVQIKNRFGSPSEYGEAWIGYTFKNGYKVAVKKMPLGEDDQFESYTNKQLLSGDSAWSEMASYMLSTILVMANICPNLPVLYKYFWCPKCHFVNKQITPKTQPCLIVINELAEGDLKMYLEKKPQIWNHNLITNCLFQIAAGLYSLQKFYNLTHNDLHYGNVLVHEVQPGGFWHYLIDGKNYYIPNLGYVFVLWDFGMAHIPGKIRGSPEFSSMSASPLVKETDIGQIAVVMYDELTTPKARKYLGKRLPGILSLIIKNEKRKQSVKEILHKYFVDYRKSHNLAKSDIIDTFNMDIRVSSLRDAHPRELRKFLR